MSKPEIYLRSDDPASVDWPCQISLYGRRVRVRRNIEGHWEAPAVDVIGVGLPVYQLGDVTAALEREIEGLQAAIERDGTLALEGPA